MRRLTILAACVLVAALSGCGDSDYSLDDQAEKGMSRLSVDRSYLRDAEGRYAMLSGVNAGTKQPVTYQPISYVDMPFPVEDADYHFQKMKSVGFNVIRLLVYWEGIEPYGKGQYDTAYLDYLEQIVAAAERNDVYVLMDMHQDMFSRHLFVFYNDDTDQNWLLDPEEAAKAAPYGFNNRHGGDGAPEWVVQAALPEKDVGGPEWGLPILQASSPKNTSNVLPWGSWFLNVGTSVDINRGYAALFAGDRIMPNYKIDGQGLGTYLREAYANSFAEVAKRVGGYPNVIGYDIMNEPGAIFVAMTLWALIFREADMLGGALTDAQVLGVVNEYMKTLTDLGMAPDEAEAIKEIFLDYDLLPSSTDEVLGAGFGDADPNALFYIDLEEVFQLNLTYSRDYLQPFFEEVGQAILRQDPDAIIWVEPVIALLDRGIAGAYAQPMRPLEGVPDIVFAPHWYTDIYPFLGFDHTPRDFTVDEVRYRDYMSGILDRMDLATFSLGNPPVVFGEFGTYYNFGGIDKSVATDYEVSKYILDPYYETFEELLLSRILWCYSIDNEAHDGERWNKEDFSILDFNGELRAQMVYGRPYPAFAAGRPEDLHFYSDYHYYDPIENRPDPVREFYFRMGAKETNAPTEIVVPLLQYPDGFYVYVSDGWCAYDDERSILYWYVDDDDPNAAHDIRLRPPYETFGDGSWDYFFDGEVARENERG